MDQVWFASDHHLGHANLLTFVGGRHEFKTIEEHDETIIANHNELVGAKDRVYFMGDVVINRKFLPLISRMNGRKKLIKGNHDIFNLKDYTPYFEDIISYKIYSEHGLIISHIPVHVCQLEGRWKFNVHGHSHRNIVKKQIYQQYEGMVSLADKRYINLCLEHTEYKPVSLSQLIERMKDDPPITETISIPA